jgi:hypothetical protein
MTPGRVKRLERYKSYGWLYAGFQRRVWPGYKTIGHAGI